MSTKSCRHLGFGKKEIVLATSGHENHAIMADLLQLDGFLEKEKTPTLPIRFSYQFLQQSGIFPMW